MTLYVIAAVVGVLSAGRITRLAVDDDFPPIMWLRLHYVAKVGPQWGKLAECPWCFGPYASAFVLAWAYLSELSTPWWLFNGWMAGSYLASYFVFHDEDGS